jgi:predicted P-loop ATPase
MDNLPGCVVPDSSPISLRELHPKTSGSPAFPDLKASAKGEKTPLPTAENVAALMEFLGVGVTYDVMQKRVRAINVRRVTDDENDFNQACAMLESEAARHGLKQPSVARFLDPLARLNPSNVPLDYLEKNVPRGGISEPIKELVRGAGMSPPDFAETALTRWLIQACAAADSAKRGHTNARTEFGYVLVLAGQQGVKKTSLLHSLMTAELHPYFSPGRTLELSNKDSLIAAVSNWVIELGELDATFKKSDIAAMKAFFTNHSDVIRAPYAKEASRFIRRTVFVATVNHTKFLMDDTGNRRFWPITVTQRMEWPEGLAAAIWAEAWQRYLAGEQWWLTAEEEIIHSKVVRLHEEKPLQERLLDYYEFESDTRCNKLSCSEILREINWPNSDKSALTTLGMMLSQLGVEKTGRKYRMPPRSSANSYNL